MITTARQRAEHFTRQEQETRLLIRERTDDLRATAEHIIDARIERYPKNMRRHREVFIEQLFRDLRDEDLERKRLIDNQQHFLRLAHFYETRAGNE